AGPWRGRCARRPPRVRIPRRSHSRGDRGSAVRTRERREDPAAPAGRCRLLPRPLLRLRRRRRAPASRARPQGAPPRRRLPRVAPRRPRRRAELKRATMLLRPFLYYPTACASYLFGCGTHAKLAVVDPHAELVDDYLATAAALCAPIVAVFETHVQADHVSGLPALVERSGATAYLPAGADVYFGHIPLAHGEVVELGNTVVRAIATPGHAPAHHAYAVADRRRGTEPWLGFTGDSLLRG